MLPRASAPRARPRQDGRSRVDSRTVPSNRQGEKRHKPVVDVHRWLHNTRNGDPLALLQAHVRALVDFAEIDGNGRTGVSQEHELRPGDPLEVTMNHEPAPIV